MDQYKPVLSRAAFAIAALVMSSISLGVMVILPALLNSEGGTAQALAFAIAIA